MKRFNIFTVTFIAVFALQLNAQITLDLKVFLEGPFNGTNMNTGLNVQNLIPLNQPYYVTPWNYAGTEQVSSIPNPDIVDWVLVELRETTGDATTATPNKMINEQAAFIKADGSIVGTNGSSMIIYSGSVTSNLYVIIWHRNHLAIMSSIPLIQTGGIYAWDFTDNITNAYLNGQKLIGESIYGMIGGDSDANGTIGEGDKTPCWNLNAGENGYLRCDLNMDSEVNNQDKDNIWNLNLGAITQIPIISPFVCGNNLIDQRDGQSYNTIQIGDQCWMAANLNIGNMINGNSDQTNNSIIEKFCFDNYISNCDAYGGLYQWNEMMKYSNIEEIQGICPVGWHIPSDEEWCALTQFIDTTVNCNITGWSGTDAGYKLRSSTGWAGGNGNDQFGFSALPAGWSNWDHTGFYQQGIFTYIWSSSENSNNAWCRGLYNGEARILRPNHPKNDGFSVRCIEGNIIANLPPSIPLNPNPTNGAVNNPINTILSWTCTDPDEDPLTYDVYFGTTNPPPLVLSGQATNTYNPGLLAYSHVYYWKINAHDDHDNTSLGPIWNLFTYITEPTYCGNPLIDSRDGHSYNTVQIGNQCWMAENLNIGSIVPIGTVMSDNGIIEKYCHDNDLSTCDTYGGHYYWHEMMQYTYTEGVKGICPTGWHLPSDGEWTQLSDYLGGVEIAGGKMKEAGYEHWMPPNTGATNESGFTGLPGGKCENSEWSVGCGEIGYSNLFWTSTVNGGSVWYRALNYNKENLNRGYFYTYGYWSVRCVFTCNPSFPESGNHIVLPTSIQWSWNSVPGAKGYKWNTTDDFYTAIDTGTDTVKFESGLDCNTTYNRYVWAYTYCGNSTPTLLSQTTFLNPPIEGIHESSLTEITWNWYSAPGAIGYKWNITNDYNTAIDIGNDTSRIETGLACNTPYTRYLWAYSSCDNSIPVILIKSTMSIPIEVPVAGIHIPMVDQIIWNWNMVSDAIGYKWNTTNNYNTAIDLGNNTFYTETGLTCNSTYTRYVWAYRDCGKSEPVALSQTTTYPSAPIAGIHSASSNYIKWKWYHVPGTLGFKWNTSNDINTAIDIDTDTIKVETCLNCDTTYVRYLWAYCCCATSDVTILSKSTQSCSIEWTCGEPFTDLRDCKLYNTIQIGNQCWMTQNMNIGTIVNGATNQQDNGVIEKYCYNNTEGNCDTYGGLYQWDEAMQYVSTPKTQGICPEGWHIPTDGEWTMLTNFLGEENVAGGKMKETGYSHWASPNTGATNESGFTALPGGENYYNSGFNSFNSLHWRCNLWSSSSYVNRILGYNFEIVSRESSANSDGLSIRCLKTVPGPNVPPNQPYNPNPSNSSSNISLNTNLTWICNDPDGDPLTYDVYFGTSSNPPLVTSGQLENYFDPPNLLAINTTYYWKIKAHDDHTNMTIGPLWNFTTRPWQCADILVDNRDGQTYATKQIGTQCWMAENLNIGIMLVAGFTTLQTDNGVLEKFCYNNSMDNCNVFGGLYQWDEMMQYITTPGSKGICPNGWHLPLVSEWIDLSDYLGGNDISGGKLKEAGTTHWNPPNTGATNSSGFTALPSGHRLYGDLNFFEFIGQYCKYRASDMENWMFSLGYQNQEAFYYWIQSLQYSTSVRCIKD